MPYQLRTDDLAHGKNACAKVTTLLSDNTMIYVLAGGFALAGVEYSLLLAFATEIRAL
jgi:hypothetical protein